MPAWDRPYGVSLSATVNIPTTTETVAITSPGINVPQNNTAILLIGHVILTTGATVTGVTYRIRRVGLTGTQVYTSGAIAAAASTLLSFDFTFVDAPGDVASGLYVVTVQQAAATGAGTVQVGSTLAALVFS